MARRDTPIYHRFRWDAGPGPWTVWEPWQPKLGDRVRVACRGEDGGGCDGTPWDAGQLFGATGTVVSVAPLEWGPMSARYGVRFDRRALYASRWRSGLTFHAFDLEPEGWSFEAWLGELLASGRRAHGLGA